MHDFMFYKIFFIQNKCVNFARLKNKSKVFNNISTKNKKQIQSQMTILSLSIRPKYQNDWLKNEYFCSEKRKIAEMVQGNFDIIIFTSQKSSFILSDCFSIKLLTNTIKNTYYKEMSILNYVDVYPLTKDILVCIINNKREIVKINKSYIQLQPQEVSIINKLMMCRSDRYCIGDLNRYKSRLSTDLKNPKFYEEKYLEILKKYDIINGKEEKEQFLNSKNLRPRSLLF